MAEQMAFDFMTDYPNDNTGWETYYESMKVKKLNLRNCGKLANGMGNFNMRSLEVWKVQLVDYHTKIKYNNYKHLKVRIIKTNAYEN